MMSGTDGGRTNISCLVDPGASTRKLISLQQCGNGIVEGDEECDPGSSGAGSACCDATTCKLKAGAACDPSNNACCSATCAFAPAGQVCRPALAGGCDVAEVCTGASGVCPADVTVPNGA